MVKNTFRTGVHGGVHGDNMVPARHRAQAETFKINGHRILCTASTAFSDIHPYIYRIKM